MKAPGGKLVGQLFTEDGISVLVLAKSTENGDITICGRRYKYTVKKIGFTSSKK